MQMYSSSKNIFITVHRDCDLEIIVIDIATKIFIGRAFVNGDVA